MTSEVAWYAARAGGLVAYVVMTMGMVFGIALAGRRIRVLPRFAIEDVHRFLGLLAGVFISIHITGILLDKVVPFSLAQVILPFTADYRPLTTGLGVVAVELLIALALTNRFRGRLPHGLWRTLHGLNFGVWVMASAHGVLTGSDRDQVWVQAMYALSAAAVVGALAWRLRGARVAPAAFGEAAVPGLLAAGLLVGLAFVAMPAAPSPAASTLATALSRGTARFSGRIEQTAGTDAQVLSVVGTGGGASGETLRIDVLQTRAGTSTSLQLRSGSGAVCSGTLETLTSEGFSGSCTLTGDRETHEIAGTWAVSGETVQGIVSVDGTGSAPAV